jgi:hypothetical protein
MKKRIIYAIFLIFIVLAAPACSKDCKSCKMVYYVGTTRDHEGSATQYCGSELLIIEATAPTTVGSYTVKYECN